jgi:hypothetical protein
LTVDGQLVGITFFYVKQQEDKKEQAPIAPIPAAPKSLSMPMSTPVSRSPMAPIQRNIK